MTTALDFFGDSAPASHTDPEHSGGPPLHLGKRKRAEVDEREGRAGYGSCDSDLEDLEQEVPNEQGNSEEEAEEGEGVAMFSGHTPMSIKERRKKKKKKKLTKETKELLRRQEVRSWD